MEKTELEQKGNKFLAELKALKDDKGAKYEFLESIIFFLKKAVKVANFKQIQKGLKDNFNQEISVSTIKRFCVDKGFYKPKAIAKKAKDSKLPAPNDKPKAENSTAQNSQKNENSALKEQESAPKNVFGKIFNQK